MDRENELLDSFKRAWRKMIVEGTGDYFKREFEDRGLNTNKEGRLDEAAAIPSCLPNS